MGDPKQEPESGQSAQAPVGRQPYEKPAVAWEERLEVRPNLMAQCNKTAAETGVCETAPGS